MKKLILKPLLYIVLSLFVFGGFIYIVSYEEPLSNEAVIWNKTQDTLFKGYLWHNGKLENARIIKEYYQEPKEEK